MREDSAEQLVVRWKFHPFFQCPPLPPILASLLPNTPSSCVCKVTICDRCESASQIACVWATGPIFCHFPDTPSLTLSPFHCPDAITQNNTSSPFVPFLDLAYPFHTYLIPFFLLALCLQSRLVPFDSLFPLCSVPIFVLLLLVLLSLDPPDPLLPRLSFHPYFCAPDMYGNNALTCPFISVHRRVCKKGKRLFVANCLCRE